MVSEMTGNYNLLVPAMWVCAIATIIARRWGIYEKQVNTRFDSPAHYGDFVKDYLEEMHVRDIFDPEAPYHCIPEYMTLREFIPIMTETNQRNFPVVNREGELTGSFSIADVRDILVERDLDNLLIMKEIADEYTTVVELDENLASAASKFSEIEVDKLPVVEKGNNRKILGMIRRRDILGSYYKRISSLKSSDD